MRKAERGEFEQRLVTLATGLELKDLRTRIDGARVSATFRIDPDTVSSAAWALMFVLGYLCFTTAGVAPTDEDTWSISDMLEHLLFENGRLFFYAATVRGRAMNTRIEVDQDGDVFVETTSRGTAVLDWVRVLQVRLH